MAYDDRLITPEPQPFPRDFPTMPIPPGAGSLGPGFKRWPKLPPMNPPGGISPRPFPGPGYTPMPIMDPPGGGSIGRPFPGPGYTPMPIMDPIPPSSGKPPYRIGPRPPAYRPGPRPIYDPDPGRTPIGGYPPIARPDFRNQPIYGNRGRPGGYYGPTPPAKPSRGFRMPGRFDLPTYPGFGDPVLQRGGDSRAILDQIEKLFG